MATHACRKQLVQLLWRRSICPVIQSRGQIVIKALKSTSHESHLVHSEPQTPTHQFTLGSLLQMGFTEAQAEEMYKEASKSRGKQVPSVLTTLFVLGLNPASILKILEKCPDVYSAKGVELQQRVDHLRKMGLVEGSLQRVVCRYPRVLILPVKRVSMVSRLLKEKCLFTTQQVTDIFRVSPEVLEEDLAQLEYKFQYVYFRMGVKQAEMVKAKLFRMSLFEVRCRHCFLERRGLYQTPDKKGQTLILNPALKDVLCASEEAYLKQVARAPEEEFRVFRKLMARELEEEELEEDFSSDEEDEDDDDDADDGQGRTKHKTGYKRDKK